MSKAEIVSGKDTVPEHYNHFYIVRQRSCRYVGMEYEIEDEYLHSDGIWRSTTLNEAGEYTGWHATREIAEQLLAQSA